MMYKKIMAIVFAVFFLSIGLISSVSAAEDKKGSISVYLEEGKEGTSVKDVEFKLVKVADLIDGTYVNDENLGISDIDMNNITTAEALNETASKVSAVIARNNISGLSKKTNDYGTAKYDDLSNGVYLLQAVDVSKYENISPTLVAVPEFNVESSNVNSMNYNISVVPKHSPIRAVETGDTANIAGYITLLVLSASVVTVSRRRMTKS
ncbi:hypothetical protein [Blautia producta]|uniref:hypothetical protein n=1 Tax=Blautia producta TaxID=33035 RepID=UPI003568F439